MLDDANSGWLYHIGDSIFEKVLLVNAEALLPVCSVYSTNVLAVSDSEVISGKSDDVFDCIILYLDDKKASDSYFQYFIDRLSVNGVLAIVSSNETSIKKIKRLNYVLSVLKLSYTRFKSIFNSQQKPVNCYYMQSVAGSVGEVFYKNGYRSVKNPFLLKEKIREFLLNKFTYRIFSSDKLCLVSKNGATKITVIDNIISHVSNETGVKYKDISKCLVIPYKVLVTVQGQNGENYIFLLLRGRDKNIRANKELEMLKYLNQSYPLLSPYLGESVSKGWYKNVEYIVYRKLPGVFVDAYFNKFNRAERSAFNMLVNIADMSKLCVTISQDKYIELTDSWFNTLKECKKNNTEFLTYVDNLKGNIFTTIENEVVNLVLFHGDYKIENLLFNSRDYSIEGVIDWDLSEKISFPGLDLIYLIIYSRRIKENKSFIEVCEDVFQREGFSEHDLSLINEYSQIYKISNKMINALCALFVVHHYSCRERCDFSSEWFGGILDAILSQSLTLK